MFVPINNGVFSPEEFKKKLEEIKEKASPMDDILDLMWQLIAFEEQYNMQTDEFYARFMRGEMGDGMDFIEWAGKYESFLEIKQEIEFVLRAAEEKNNKKLETESSK